MIAELAQRLQTSRHNCGLSRWQVAELIGVSKSMIGLYESGSRQPSLGNLIKLASIYKVTTDYLLGCETREPQTISVAGLTPRQIQAINSVISCFQEESQGDMKSY